MTTATRRAQGNSAAVRQGEPLLSQIAGFVDLFIWLLLLKSFFLPLFIIPTGSMAETLFGAHGTHVCTNCGYEYPVGDMPGRSRAQLLCGNCRWAGDSPRGLRMKVGDRIVVHGWPFDLGGALRPARWDVVVFKNPNNPQENFIKRLIGLPGETLEIIDGDIFVTREGAAHVARKPADAQRALWMPVYNHDYSPRERRDYNPRWIMAEGADGTERAGPWSGLDTRVIRFDGLQTEHSAIGFSDGSHGGAAVLQDLYSYNGMPTSPLANVTDARISCVATIEAAADAGYIELSVSKYERRFFARLYGDGRLSLQQLVPGEGIRPIAETTVARPSGPLHLALGHADYRVQFLIEGKVVLESSDADWNETADGARKRVAATRSAIPTILRIGAAGVRVQFAHLRVERDVHYRDWPGGRGNGELGNPITLGSEAYYVLGDNSPFSADSRAWTPEQLPQRLRDRLARGEYELGTVPADQMIGRAFLVYWPGFMPLTPAGPDIMLDFGRIRWIH